MLKHLGNKLKKLISPKLIIGLALFIPALGLGVKLAYADPSYTLSGSVLVNSVPISGATVEFDNFKTTTDANGDYTISNVPDGNYFALIYYDGSTTPSTSGVPVVLNVETPNSTYINVNGDTIQNLTFNTSYETINVVDTAGNSVANTPLSLSGGSDSNLGGPYLINDGTDGDIYSAIETDSQATTNSSGMASVPVFAGLNYYLCADYSGGQVCQTVNTTNTSTPITVTVPAPGTVSGQFTINSVPIPNANIEIGNFRTTTDANGDYSIPNVPANSNYTIEFWYDSDQSGELNGVPSSLTAYGPSPITVNGNITENVNLVTSEQTINVVDANGNPAPDVPVNELAGSTDLNNPNSNDTIYDSSTGAQYNISDTSENSLYTDSAGMVTVPVFNGVTYQFCVSGNNGNGCAFANATSSTPVNLTIPVQVPYAINDLSAASPTSSPALSWSSSYGATTYDVYRGNTEIGTTSSTYYNDSSAPLGNYYYHVTAVNAEGSSNISNLAYVQVVPAIIPAAPSGLTVSSSSSTLNPSLNWNSDSGASSYNVYRDGVDIASTSTNSYTDSSATPGSHIYYVTAVNSGGESSPSNSVSFIVGTLPTITSSASTTISARAQLNFTVTTTGAPSIVESGNLPEGITFTDNGNGTASFTGQASTTNQGYYFITLTATNSAGTASQSFILTVTDYLSAPTIISTNNYTAAYGAAFSLTIDTTGVEVPTIAKSGALPQGVTFKDNKDGTATISGTPSGSASGSYTLTITAKNKTGSTTQTLVLNVS